MNAEAFQLTGYDFVFVGILAFGIYRGKKRGLSEELLDVFQWLAIIVVGSIIYQPVGKFVQDFTHLDLVWCYVLVYLFTGFLIFLLFTGIKKMVGEKLVQSDAFGRMEYYFGMLAGALRYACILIFVLSILNAKYISPQERAAQIKMQQDNFGSISFPTLASSQQTVFYESKLGTLVKTHLATLLIDSTPLGLTGLGENIGRRRQRAVDEVLK